MSAVRSLASRSSAFVASPVAPVRRIALAVSTVLLIAGARNRIGLRAAAEIHRVCGLVLQPVRAVVVEVEAKLKTRKVRNRSLGRIPGHTYFFRTRSQIT